MRFLVDAQLPPALARWLSAAGYEAEHVIDLGLGSAKDSEIWGYALAADAIIISKDEDFPQRKALRDDGPKIIWVRFPNHRRCELLVRFEALFPVILEALGRGETLIEVV